MRGAILIAVAAASMWAGDAAAANHVASPCTGGDLRGMFAAVVGSEGAGNISYALRLSNVSTSACTITGLPHVQLLNATGGTLPTHAFAAHPGEGTAILITLAPTKAAISTARFSPDVPGTGEQQIGRCEPISAKLRVTPSGHGSVVVAIKPRTSVCEHGGMAFSVFTAAH